MSPGVFEAVFPRPPSPAALDWPGPTAGSRNRITSAASPTRIEWVSGDPLSLLKAPSGTPAVKHLRVGSRRLRLASVSGMLAESAALVFPAALAADPAATSNGEVRVEVRAGTPVQALAGPGRALLIGTTRLDDLVAAVLAASEFDARPGLVVHPRSGEVWLAWTRDLDAAAVAAARAVAAGIDVIAAGSLSPEPTLRSKIAVRALTAAVLVPTRALGSYPDLLPVLAAAPMENVGEVTATLVAARRREIDRIVTGVLGLANADARAPFAGLEQSELEDLVARLIASPRGQAILVLGPPPPDPIVPDRADLTIEEILRA